MGSDDGPISQNTAPRSSRPARLSLQSGRLDDHRREITPDDDVWELAYRRFLDRDRIDTDEDVRTLCELWPVSERQGEDVEALAVTVALAAPFADLSRILEALAARTAPADRLREQLARGPALADPGSRPRPRFPRVYDPRIEDREPIIAVFDGPRCPRVGEFLEIIKEQDRSLADAIVLGAELEMLDLLDRLCLDAKRAARVELADHFEQDRTRWRERAGALRSRQRLEGAQYGWRSDNLPPACLEAAEAEVPSGLQALLDRLPPTPG